MPAHPLEPWEARTAFHLASLASAQSNSLLQTALPASTNKEAPASRRGRVQLCESGRREDKVGDSGTGAAGSGVSTVVLL